MMKQAQDFLDETHTLYALVDPLSDDELDQETGFKDWTINDVIGHLHTWNMAADMSLIDDGTFQDFYAKITAKRGEGGTLNDFESDYLGGLTGRARVAAWVEFAEETAVRFGVADPSARVKWAGPDMSVRTSITARLMETWAHGQEVFDQLGVVRENKDRIQNIVILGSNTYGWTYVVRGAKAPDPKPYLKLTAPSGDLWTIGEESETEIIEGSAEEFCQVVTQVRNIADTGLKVTGENAEDWMMKAQCFAGAATEPPAPGVRHTRVVVA